MHGQGLPDEEERVIPLPEEEAKIGKRVTERGRHVTTRTYVGVLPLVIVIGAGAAARQSIGRAVFTGIIASTCIAVFVPSFYAVMQRIEEQRQRRRAARRDAPAPPRPGAGSPPSATYGNPTSGHA